MKKYIIAMLLLFIPCVTYALTMCARDNSLVISLVGGINGITGTNTSNNAEFVWRVDYDYGTILGEATCLSDADLPGDGAPIPNDISKGLYGTSPVNSDNPDLDRSRKHCFCRMTHPASSRWVYRMTYAGCSGNCAYYCANGAISDAKWRFDMFKSIGQ